MEIYKATVTLLVTRPDFKISSSLKNNHSTENGVIYENTIQRAFISTSIMIEKNSKTSYKESHYIIMNNCGEEDEFSENLYLDLIQFSSQAAFLS